MSSGKERYLFLHVYPDGRVTLGIGSFEHPWEKQILIGKEQERPIDRGTLHNLIINQLPERYKVIERSKVTFQGSGWNNLWENWQFGPVVQLDYPYVMYQA